MLRFFTNRKERQKEGKKESSSSSSNGRKENGTISGKSFIKTILPGLGQTKGSAQWKRLIDTSLAACSEAINNFDFYFPPLSPASFLLLTQTNNKKFIKEKPKENNAQIGEETKRWQSWKEREREWERQKKVACHMAAGTPRSIHWERRTIVSKPTNWNIAQHCGLMYQFSFGFVFFVFGFGLIGAFRVHLGNWYGPSNIAIFI